MIKMKKCIEWDTKKYRYASKQLKTKFELAIILIKGRGSFLLMGKHPRIGKKVGFQAVDIIS